MKKDKIIQIVGLLATVIGLGATAAKGWVDEQNLDKKISEKVTEALAEQAKNGGS